MKTKLIVKLDKTIVKFAASILNILVMIVGKILRIDHSLDKDFKRIAIAKYKGMGSIIQSIPMLQGIRQQYAQARIYYISTPANRILLHQLAPLVDEVILLDDRSLWTLLRSFPFFFWKILRMRAQVFIDLEIYSNASSIITTISLATNRFGYYLRSSQYRTGTYTHMLFFNNHTPIAENYNQMARLLGITNFDKQNHIALDNPKYLPRNKEFIVLNPNASDLRLERRWPMHSFATLIKMLLHHGDHEIVLIGSKDEASYVNQLVDLLPENPRIINMAGHTALIDLFGLIKQAALVITNDTGPMHLSFYYQRPTIALFGPCHPAHYGIQSPNVYIHYTHTYCSPCVHEFEIAPCKGDNVCMKNIEVADVLLSINDCLQNKALPTTNELIKYTGNNKVYGQLKL